MWEYSLLIQCLLTQFTDSLDLQPLQESFSEGLQRQKGKKRLRVNSKTNSRKFHARSRMDGWSYMLLFQLNFFSCWAIYPPKSHFRKSYAYHCLSLSFHYWLLDRKLSHSGFFVTLTNIHFQTWKCLSAVLLATLQYLHYAFNLQTLTSLGFSAAVLSYEKDGVFYPIFDSSSRYRRGLFTW